MTHLPKTPTNWVRISLFPILSISLSFLNLDVRCDRNLPNDVTVDYPFWIINTQSSLKQLFKILHICGDNDTLTELWSDWESLVLHRRPKNKCLNWEIISHVCSGNVSHNLWKNGWNNGSLLCNYREESILHWVKAQNAYSTPNTL